MLFSGLGTLDIWPACWQDENKSRRVLLAEEEETLAFGSLSATLEVIESLHQNSEKKTVAVGIVFHSSNRRKSSNHYLKG
jgi:hypothetical protein